MDLGKFFNLSWGVRFSLILLYKFNLELILNSMMLGANCKAEALCWGKPGLKISDFACENGYLSCQPASSTLLIWMAFLSVMTSLIYYVLHYFYVLMGLLQVFKFIAIRLAPCGSGSRSSQLVLGQHLSHLVDLSTT